MKMEDRRDQLLNHKEYDVPSFRALWHGPHCTNTNYSAVIKGLRSLMHHWFPMNEMAYIHFHHLYSKVGGRSFEMRSSNALRSREGVERKTSFCSDVIVAIPTPLSLDGQETFSRRQCNDTVEEPCTTRDATGGRIHPERTYSCFRHDVPRTG